MQLSPHFSLAEMTESQTAARLGLDNKPPAAILSNLQGTALAAEPVRALLGRPMLVSSGFRSPKVNAAVGGAKTSAHLQGYAMDFICPGFGDPLAVCRKIAASGIKFDQLIQEGTWVHISFDPRMRMQIKTAHFSAGPTQYTGGL